MAATDWISLADAKAITGVAALTEDNLEAASVDVFDEMRWKPIYSRDLLITDDEDERYKAKALGRAIAWQAAHSVAQSASPGDTVTTYISSESLDGHSVAYAGRGKPVDIGAIVAYRVKLLLRQYGLYRMSGYTTTDDSDFDENESIIRIS